MVVLAVVVMGTQLSPGLHAARLAPASLAIAAIWLMLLNRAGRGLPWREGGDAPDSQPERARDGPGNPGRAMEAGVTRRAGLSPRPERVRRAGRRCRRRSVGPGRVRG
ncbi:hypothetical protein GCM10017687_68300 [Streptomyces echinatus]